MVNSGRQAKDLGAQTRDANAPDELVVVTARAEHNSPDGRVEQGDSYELPLRTALTLQRGGLVELGDTDGVHEADVRVEVARKEWAKRDIINKKVEAAKLEGAVEAKGAKLEESEGQAGLAAWSSGDARSFIDSETAARQRLAAENQGAEDVTISSVAGHAPSYPEDPEGKLERLKAELDEAQKDLNEARKNRTASSKSGSRSSGKGEHERKDRQADEKK